MSDIVLPIGGEIHHGRDRHFRYFTDSGRSSLRLILKNLQGRYFALPDFLCGIIIDVFREAGAKFALYHINDNLSIDYDSIDHNIDVLYVIDYFGKRNSVDQSRIFKKVLVIQDSVFDPGESENRQTGSWIWYNSYRKISPLSDGSMIISTVELDADDLRPGPAPFVSLKRAAKHAKDDFLRHGIGSEDTYLQLFRAGEDLLDTQKTIHGISQYGLALLLDFLRRLAGESTIRQSNYDILHRELSDFAIDLGSGFKTMYVMNVDRRDELRKDLFDRRIYLPVHWPDVHQLGNPLSRRILSIPVDSRYSASQLQYVASCVQKFVGLSR